MKTLHTSKTNRFQTTLNEDLYNESEFLSFEEINLKEIESADFDRDLLEMPSDMYGDIY